MVIKVMGKLKLLKKIKKPFLILISWGLKKEMKGEISEDALNIDKFYFIKLIFQLSDVKFILIFSNIQNI